MPALLLLVAALQGVPRTQLAAEYLTFDFPAMRIGVAEYDEGPTGATLFWFPRGVMAAVDARGGAPGTINTDGLRLSYESHFVRAISLAGGSAYGLAAATGAALEIKAQTQNPTDWQNIAVVAGAIVFDLGARRFNAVTPDEALGRAAIRASVPGRFPQGAHGAGRFTMQGGWFNNRMHSGQGGAFRQAGPTKVAVFTVVNSLGAVVDRQGRVVRCSNDPAQQCPLIKDYLAQTMEPRLSARTQGENTTITLVVTNQRLDFWALQRLAVQVHTSMARGIQPFHTENDGDVLFAVTTNEVDNPALAPVDLGVLASEVAWDAILASVPRLPPMKRDTVTLTAGQMDLLAGDYDFGGGTRLTVTRRSNQLVARASGRQAFYGFALNEEVGLIPNSAVSFTARNARLDVLRFEPDGTLVLNPQPWELRGKRIR